MNNTNNPTTTPAPQVNEAPNRKFYIQTLEKHLSPDKVKQILGDLNKDWTDDRVEPVLKKDDQDKIAAYDKLEAGDLPFDWKIKFERLTALEKKQVNFNEIKKELVSWTDTFSGQKPNEVQEQIKQLEAEKNRIERELNDKIKDLESNLETSQKEKQAIEKNLGEKITELEKSLSEWTQTFANRQLAEVKKEWEDLQQRPDITITEQEWLDDYARRQSVAKAQEKEQEITKKEEELTKTKEANWQLFCQIRKFLKEWRTRLYVQIEEWPTTVIKAKEKIVQLLAEIEQEWNYYLNDNNITAKNIPLVLGSQDKDKNIISRIYQVLAWIKEAQTTADYQTLFERWNNGSEYNEEYDYDAGSLYLLGEFLKVKDPQP